MEDSDRILNAAEIIKDRLYFVTFKASTKPKNTANTLYFCTDETFVYENFYWDFGPLNICHVYNYCEMLSAKLEAKSLQRKKIVHYTSAIPQKRLNAAFLVGAYAIINLEKTAEEAFEILTKNDTVPYMKFRDASNLTPLFEISLIDCLHAIEKGLKYRFFDFSDFNAIEYEFFERVENGDLNWILPRKFIAMCGPHRTAGIVKGYPQHAPESYFDYFRRNSVKHIIRLNCKSYDAKQFTENGFKHLEMFFPDGSCPNDPILQKFLEYCEQTSYGIAVHCKAGLGRTGSLIGAYLVKHFMFTALEAIAWLRLCRPGSVIGHQQKWLEEKQDFLWAEGEKYRKKHKIKQPEPLEYGIYSNVDHTTTKTDRLGGISNQVNNINLNDESSSSPSALDKVNNNDSNNNNNSQELDDNRNNNNSSTAPTNNNRLNDNFVCNSAPPRRETVASSAKEASPNTRQKTSNLASKTQGDELNEIKATRRRHTRSHNLDHSVMQRFVAKNVAAKGKDHQAGVTSSAGGQNATPITGQAAYLRRTRLLKLIGDNKNVQSATTGSAASATVLAKNLRNSVNLVESNNNKNNSLTISKRNKRSIHERENNTGASKISRRYASTTMAVQQKQKDPVGHHSQSSALIVKKMTVQSAGSHSATSGSVALTAAGGSKTYPGPTTRTKF